MILVLLVDADPVMRLVASALTALNAGVVAHHVSGLDGLAMTLNSVLVDLVVADLSLTGRGPHDALAAVRSLWSGPLAALTGDASVAAESACVQHAAPRWLKPLSPRDLADAIRAHPGVRP